MKITVLNTRNNEEHTYYSFAQIDHAFNCDTFGEHHTLRSYYNEWIEEIRNADYADEEERQEELDYILNVYPEKIEIHDSEIEYYTEMIEYETWCSPRGVESEFKVIEVEV